MFVRKSHLLQRRIWLSRLNSIPYSDFEKFGAGREYFDASAQKAEVQEGAQNGNESRKATIRRFNPNKGLLGALKFASQGPSGYCRFT